MCGDRLTTLKYTCFLKHLQTIKIIDNGKDTQQISKVQFQREHPFSPLFNLYHTDIY